MLGRGARHDRGFLVRWWLRRGLCGMRHRDYAQAMAKAERMIRLYIAFAAVLGLGLLIAGSIYIGTRWDDAADANAKSETLERTQNADVSKGNANEDRNWVNGFLDGLRTGD